MKAEKTRAQRAAAPGSVHQHQDLMDHYPLITLTPDGVHMTFPLSLKENGDGEAAQTAKEIGKGETSELLQINASAAGASAPQSATAVAESVRQSQIKNDELKRANAELHQNLADQKEKLRILHDEKDMVVNKLKVPSNSSLLKTVDWD